MNKNIDIVDAWIKLQTLPQDSEEAENLMWSAEDVITMSISSPSECWSFILDVVKRTDDEWVLTNLAAGPLENILSMSPVETIGWIEEEAKKNSKFKNILKDVWQNLMPDGVFKRVKSL